MFNAFRVSIIGLLVFLSGCAAINQVYENPQVSVSSFGLDPESTGITPTFLIGLKVVNPNRLDLSLEGMSYTVEIEGERIFTGAEAELPTVPAYGSAEIKLRAIPDLFGGARLIQRLMTSKNDTLNYNLKAKLDLGSLYPTIPLEEKGEFSLSGKTTKAK